MRTSLASLCVLCVLCMNCGGDKSPTAPTTTTTTIPPAPVTSSITGRVTVGSSSVAIVGADVRALDGANAGKIALTDGNGRYELAGLVVGTFSLGISAPGYPDTFRNVSLSTTPQTVNVALLPIALYARSGTGDTVFDMPTYIARVRVQATYAGNSSNFVVYVAGRLLVNELLGRGWNMTAFDGTYLTSGGVTEIRLSSGVAWTFTEVR